MSAEPDDKGEKTLCAISTRFQIFKSLHHIKLEMLDRIRRSLIGVGHKAPFRIGEQSIIFKKNGLGRSW